MKQLFGLLICCFFAAVSFAQYGTVTLKINGSKNLQVMIDGKTYTSNAALNNTITITDLMPGEHTIRISGNNKGTNASTTFTLRTGYDVNLNVNGKGGISVREKKSATTTAVISPAMSNADFTVLLNAVHKKRLNSSRVSAVREAFNNRTNYFNAAQVSQLLQEVTGETTRLQLAKSAYNHITDQGNISSIYTLLLTQASRDQLAAYINTYTVAGTYPPPMSTTDFNNLVQHVQSQWQSGAKYNTIHTAFDGPVHFTSVQARQLIQIIDGEDTRLQLAKTVYGKITDLVNFSYVMELLSSPAARNELALYIRQQGGDVAASYSETYREAMTNADFQVIVAELRKQWLPGTKMAVASNALGNTGNNFSAAQIREVLSYISSEPNKLQLLKSGYANATDQKNYYNELYDLLLTQPARDELNRYINTYNGF